MLAAIAARTERIRLTSAVIVLSVLDPVRVYPDFATVELVSSGRAEIIAGRSAFAEPFALFGQDMNDYDALFTEKVELLLRLRAESNVTWSGKFRPPLHDAPIAPRAGQAGLPVWAGVGGSPSSAVRAGLFDWGGLPRGLVEESLHRYATEIARLFAEGSRAPGWSPGPSVLRRRRR